MDWRVAARDAVLDALAVVMPVECAGCGRPDRAVCAECRVALAPEPVARTLPDGTAVWTALRYEGAVRASVLAFKDHGRTDLARALAPALRAAVVSAVDHARSVELSRGIESVLGVEPAHRIDHARGVEFALVPSSRAARRRRGFDPVRLLASRARIRSLRVLEHVGARAAQKSLGAADRASNSRGSLRVRHRLDGRRLVVVDDVLTTGSTLVEAARALRDAGAEVVAAVALAYTPKWMTRSADSRQPLP